MNKKLKSEKSLITRCKKDITAFEKLYKKYVKDVYRYVYVVVKDKEVAEDITSQAFLTAIEKVKDFEWRGISIKYWFLKIARNLVSKQISKPKDISFDEKYEIKNLDRMLIEDVVIEEELKNKLKELIFRLDDTTREIISLRIWENLKFKEISELIEMKQATVITKFTRGVKKLQKVLESDRKDKRLYSVNLVSIIVGIKCLKKIPDFLPSVEFLKDLAVQITSKINLIIKNIDMNSNRQTQDSSGIEQAASVSAKGTKGLYIALGTVGVAVVAGVSGIVGYKIGEARDEDTQPVVTQDEEKEDTSVDESETSASNDVETQTEDTSDSVDTQEAESMSFEYLWYEDDYIKFQYPKGWSVTVNTDKNPIVYTGLYDNNEENLAEGVQRIYISKDDTYIFEMTIPRKGLNGYSFGHGWDKYTYYFDNPGEVEWTSDVMFDGAQYYELIDDPLVFETEEYDVSLISFSKVDEELLLLGEVFEDRYVGYLPYFIEEFDFMAVDEDGNKIMTSVELTCPTEFDVCSEFLNQFFVTVEKK